MEICICCFAGKRFCFAFLFVVMLCAAPLLLQTKNTTPARPAPAHPTPPPPRGTRRAGLGAAGLPNAQAGAAAARFSSAQQEF